MTDEYRKALSVIAPAQFAALSSSKWGDELREILSATDLAEQALRDLHRYLWDNVVASDVWPRELPEDLRNCLEALTREIEKCSRAAEKAFERCSSVPINKVLAEVPLSREQYYLCRAMGMDLGTAREVGLIDFDDYQIYRMLCYEDDNRWAYINIHLAPREPHPTQVAARFGRPPEEFRRRFLRPEQHDFFREFLPDVYKRFRID